MPTDWPERYGDSESGVAILMVRKNLNGERRMTTEKYPRRPGVRDHGR